jgi:hypothetical protein
MSSSIVKTCIDYQSRVYKLLYKFCETNQINLDKVLVPNYNLFVLGSQQQFTSYLQPLDQALGLSYDTESSVCHMRKKFCLSIAHITPEICWVKDGEFSNTLPKFELMFIELHGYIDEINEEFKGICFFIENICDILTSEFGLCELEQIYAFIPNEYQLFVDDLTLPLVSNNNKKGHIVLFKEGLEFLLHNFLEHPKYSYVCPSVFAFISDLLRRICSLLTPTPLL